jgi:hypothetical protein
VILNLSLLCLVNNYQFYRLYLLPKDDLDLGAIFLATLAGALTVTGLGAVAGVAILGGSITLPDNAPVTTTGGAVGTGLDTGFGAGACVGFGGAFTAIGSGCVAFVLLTTAFTGDDESAEQ